MPEPITLSTLAGGDLEKRFQKELKRVLENIADPNFKQDAKRSITLGITLKPDKKGQVVELHCMTKVTLPGEDTVSTTSWLGADRSDPKKLTLYGMNIRQGDLFNQPESTTTEIRQVSPPTAPAAERSPFHPKPKDS